MEIFNFSDFKNKISQVKVRRKIVNLIYDTLDLVPMRWIGLDRIADISGTD